MKDSSSKITVVVPFRIVENLFFAEGRCFELFLNSLKKITPFVSEVILVNDHSSSQALDMVSSVNEGKWKIISLPENMIGKKEALLRGISEATSEYIWTLDADVEISNFDAASLNEFQKNLLEDIVILPVEMKKGKRLIEILQYCEWRYLQWLTFFSARMNLPMMCNGANLIFKRSIFIRCIDMHKSISSGDDLFLLTEIIRKNGKVGLQWKSFTRVQVSSETTLNGAVSQRIRWAGKTSKLPFSKSTFLHVGFALLSALHLFALFGIFYQPTRWISEVFLVLKLFFECNGSARIFSEPIGFFEAILLVVQLLLYPVFSLAIFISSLFYKPNWKQRRVSLK